MKKLLYILLLFPFFIACSSDDDEDGGQEPQKDILAGTTWSQTIDEVTYTFKFDTDGKCNFTRTPAGKPIDNVYNYTIENNSLSLYTYLPNGNGHLQAGGTLKDNILRIVYENIELNLQKVS